MKALFSWIALVAIFSISFFNAAPYTNQADNREIQAFVKEAAEKETEMQRLLASVKKARQTSFAKKYAQLLQDGIALAKKVQKAGSGMSSRQYSSFQTSLKRLGAQTMTLGQTNSTAGDSPASCMQECDAAYPGWGGGNGWNRFWCKAACLKIKVSLPGGGGAGVG